MKPGIAIVGMACRYPDSRSPDELWENVLAQRRAFRRMPPERLRLADYHSPDRSVPDAIYSTEAAVIDGWEFDRVRFRVAGSTYRTADLAHWLALDVATQALDNAGFGGGERLPRETTGAVVGNTLTGEFSRANTLRLRWPYVMRVVAAELERAGMPAGERQALLARLEAEYKRPFPPVGEESLAGGLSNTIAGRICNHFDLKGGGWTVDGACAASLLAVITACQALDARDLDVAVAGGVDLSLDPFELVGFAKTGALAPEEMRVYDTRSQGFWPGEGCGFVVLMREQDALAERRRVYAIIRGWGISSDGSGGITRPERDGQMLAIARAYRRAGFGAHTVTYVEGHGTGTAVGDATELDALSRARRDAGAAPPAAIGSIKANFGHTKAAAGIAGLLKATLAVHHQIIPPTTGCERPHALLSASDAALMAMTEGGPWPEDRPLRASVSAMGFGGINTHLVLDGADTRRASVSPKTRVLLDSWQDAELFLFGAATAGELARQVERIAVYAARLSRAELADLAATLARSLAVASVRAAVLASKPAELEGALGTLAGWLAGGVTDRVDAEAGVFLGSTATAPRIAFLFSGQASPVYLHGGAIARRFAGVRDTYRRAVLPNAADTVATAVAQPAIVAASLAGLDVLRVLGIDAAVALGHSLGEISALHWAGVMDEAATLEVARVRGRAMMETPGPPSGMLGIAAAADEVATILPGTPVVIAGLNLPHQTVVSGERQALEVVAARAREHGWRAAPLAVSHAFHSPLMAPAAPALRAQIERTVRRPLARPVASTIAGARLAETVDVADLLTRQLTSPVRFMDAVAALGEVDLVIEVGPGQVLTGLARELVACPVIALDAGGPSLRGVLAAAGAAFVLGGHVRHDAMFDGRFTRPFELDWSPRFLASPCELAPAAEVAGALVASADAPPATPAPDAAAPATTEPPLELMRRLVAERAELPLAAVRAESRLLDDLHLNSIAVGTLAAAAARALGLEPSVAPNEYADATVAELARALEERVRTGGRAAVPEGAPAGVAPWIRAFTLARVPREAPRPASSSAPSRWRVFAPADHPLRERLVARLAAVSGDGVVACLPPGRDARTPALLLEAAQAALATRPRARFVVVQADEAGGGFARSLHLESPDAATCVVRVPFADARAAEWVAAEAAAATGFFDVRWDENGARTESVLRLLDLPDAGDAPVAAGDVVLVTGGGKGIAAECALDLAREHGCALALVGRSDPAADSELAANLERVRAAGVHHVYLRADVADPDSVRAAVHAAESALGPITGVIHGAGVNTPELVRSLALDAFERTVRVKARGAEHVLAALDVARLQLFVGFGSIIARTGLRGEADYALANEWLSGVIEDLARRAPQCRTLAIEWSVWSGVGMGERLGRVDALASQGVQAISPDEGLAWFRRLVGARLPVSAVVVSGRFGAPPTLGFDAPELPLRRFLEQPRVHVPGVELVSDVTLSPSTDPYLDDHVLDGVRLFPAVMGLEAMAQVALALVPDAFRPAFEDVAFERPVAVESGGTTIRIAALVRAPGVVDVALRCADTGFAVDHFRATCRFAPALADPEPAPAAAPNGHAVTLDLERDLYGSILFHRGRFRRLRGYRRLRATACTADLSPDGGVEWFGRYQPATLELGDPGARDGAIHAVQACIPHATVLPVGVARLTLEVVPASEPRTIEAREIERHGSVLVYDVDVRDGAGMVRERWRGLRLQIVGDRARRGPWSPALLGPYLERRVGDLVGRTAAVGVVDEAAADRHARTSQAIERALGEHATVRRRTDGKPEVDGHEVSAAHAGSLTLAVASNAPVGCDLEAVTARSETDWRGLLGAERWSLAEQVARAASEDLDAAATRVWSAMECAKKAGASAASFRIAATAPDGWVVLESGPLTAATATVTVHGTSGQWVAAILTTGSPCAPTSTGTSSASRKPISSGTSTTSTT